MPLRLHYSGMVISSDIQAQYSSSDHQNWSIIECLYDYTTVEWSSALIFYSNVKGTENSRIENTVFHVETGL